MSRPACGSCRRAGPGKIVVTGPRRSVDGFSVEGGGLRDQRWRTGTSLEIVVHAPKITHFSAQGRDKLVIEGFDQPELRIETVGRAEVKKVFGAGGPGNLAAPGIRLLGRDRSALAATEADVA